MPKSDQLVAQAPSETAILGRHTELVATSGKSIKRGEGMYLDERGVAFARPQLDRSNRRWRIGSNLSSIAGSVLLGAAIAMPGMALAAIPGGLLYLGSLAPGLLQRYRGLGKLVAIELVVRQGHLDEGERRLNAVPALRKRNPVRYGTIAGTIAAHRGDHARALGWFREAFPYATGLAREMLKLHITRALLLSGKIEEARRELASLSLPPEADAVLTGASLTQIMLVLLDPSAAPPSDEDLHDWTRRALEYSHTGSELAALGWLFEKQGDVEMVNLLAAEAVERLHTPYLKTWWPALGDWLDAHPPA